MRVITQMITSSKQTVPHVAVWKLGVAVKSNNMCSVGIVTI
jgi:hypothetical protein